MNFLSQPSTISPKNQMASDPGKILIAVGSTRKPKLGAVREALGSIGPLLASNQQVEVVGVEVESGVGHTPISREELMQGARQRAEAVAKLARRFGEPWRFFVGLEGGLDVIRENGRRRVFLESWAYVSDGSSAPAALKLPKRLQKTLWIAAWNFL